jgi:hypothetical protein
MAIIGDKYATIIDRAKFQDKEGKTLPFIRALSQANALIYWWMFEECNQARSHEITVETSSPLPSTRIMNRGTIPSYAKAAQLEEEVAILEDWLEVDEQVALRGGDAESYRVEQSFSKMEAFGRKATYLFFYGNRGTTPSDFNGLSMRYSAGGTNVNAGSNAINILDGGGRNNTNSSIWLVGMGPRAITGIYPKGGVSGFRHRNWGLKDKETAVDISGNTNASMSVYKDQFTWELGLCVADWRHAVRTANIDTPSVEVLQNDADLAYFLDEMKARLPFETNVPPEPGVEQIKPTYYWFMNRAMQKGLRHQIKNTVIQGAGLAKDGYERAYNPQWMWEYDGHPIGICDQLLTTEGNVAFV